MNITQLFLKKELLNENQLFSILRIIQNFENRREIFKEGARFNKMSSENRTFANNSDENEVEIMEDSAICELNDKFNQKNWNEFLNEISRRISEKLVRNSGDF